MKADYTNLRIKGEAMEALDKIRGSWSRDAFVAALILYAKTQGIRLMMTEPKRVNLSERKIQE